MKQNADRCRNQQSPEHDDTGPQRLTDGGGRDEDDHSQHQYDQPRREQPPRGHRQPPQNRQSPQERQGRQSPQGQQGRQSPQGPPDGQPPQSDEGGGVLSRRRLLFGGAGAAVAAVAGGWHFFLRGPSGAKAVADEYVNAVAENDWAAIEELFHEESETIQRIESDDETDNYESLLENDGRLDRLEGLSPSVKDHIEFEHYPEFDEQAAEVIGFNLPGPEVADSIDEVKRIVTIIEVDISTAFPEDDERGEYLAGETTTEAANAAVVLSEGEWSLWDSFI